MKMGKQESEKVRKRKRERKKEREKMKGERQGERETVSVGSVIASDD